MKASNSTGIDRNSSRLVNNPFHKLPDILVYLLVFFLAAIIYAFGMPGSFILDDTPNLAVINELPNNATWRDYWYLASSGLAGDLGRPVSLLTFLLQVSHWPNPGMFKLVNIGIHLINGVLILLCCRLIGANNVNFRLSVLPLALILLLWLVHPIQISSVLYVVQRMAELSATFTLLGIAAYLYGRKLVLTGNGRLGLFLMIAGTWLAALLAVLSKENGVLIFLYLAVLELTLLNDSHRDSLRPAQWSSVYGPLLLGILAALILLPELLDGYTRRQFTLPERSLSQVPVLATYVAAILLIDTDNFGVFHDDFPLSDTTAEMALALAGLLLLLSLAALAWRWRQQRPLLAFGLLWFLAGHALESTILPLELYFEHRNYLALFGPVFAGVVWATGTLRKLSVTQSRLFTAIGSLLILWLCFNSLQQTRLWGNPVAQAYAAVEEHPGSYRAHEHLVLTLTSNNQTAAAFEYHLQNLDPGSRRVSQYVRWLEFNCLLENIPLPTLETLQTQAELAVQDYGAVFSLNNLTMGIVQGRCPNAPITLVRNLIVSLILNTDFEDSWPDLHQLAGFLYAYQDDFDSAAQQAEQSLALRADARVALFRVTWLLRAGDASTARSILNQAQQEFADDFNSSSDLAARRDFLQSELDVRR